MGGKSTTEIQVSEYHLSIDYGVCHGTLNSLNEVWVKEQLVWSGHVTSNQTVTLNAPDAFGGEKKEGGPVGVMDVYMGGPAQLMTDASALRYGLTPTTMPGYRGIAHVMFRGDVPDKGFLWVTNNPYLPPAWLNVTRIPSGWLENLASIRRTETQDGTPLGSDVFFTVTVDGVANAGSATNGARFDGLTAGEDYDLDLEAGSWWSAWATTKYLGLFQIKWDDGVWTTHEPSPGGSFFNPFSSVYDTPEEVTANAVTLSVTARTSGGVIVLDNGYPAGDNAGSLGIRFSRGIPPKEDANPAHMIRECLMDQNWGLGVPSGDIGPSFAVAAQTLFDENFGLTMMWTQQSTVEKLVQEISDHIQAMVYLDPDSGLWEISLIRGDYDVAVDDLVQLNPSNCTANNRQRKAMSETINEITVTYTSPYTGEDVAIPFQDIANIAMQGGVRSSSRNYYGIRQSALAQAVGARDLRTSSYPLFSCNLVVDTTVGTLKPGQVVLFDWPDDDIYGMPLRVYKVGYGKPGASSMSVSVTEDIFGLGVTSYVPLDAAVNDPEATPPTPLDYVAVVTPPLPMLLRSGLSLSDVEDGDYPAVFLAFLGNSITGEVTSIKLTEQVVKANGELVEEVVVELPDTPLQLSVTELAWEASTTITGDDLRGLLGPYISPETGTFMRLGTADETCEMVLVYSHDSGSDTYVLARGIFDTVPRLWPVGSVVWYLADRLDQLVPTEQASGVSGYFKAQTVNSSGVLPIANAAQLSFTPSDRPYLPHRPGNVSVEGETFPAMVVDCGAVDFITVSWANRNRLSEDTVAPIWGSTNVTPEVGQTVEIVLLDTDTGLEFARVTGLTGTTHELDKALCSGRIYADIRVESKRGTFSSWQGHTIRILVGYGYGISYGRGYGGAA